MTFNIISSKYNSADKCYYIYLQGDESIKVDQALIGLNCYCEGPGAMEEASVTYDFEIVEYIEENNQYVGKLYNISCSYEEENPGEICSFNIQPTYAGKNAGEPNMSAHHTDYYWSTRI